MTLRAKLLLLSLSVLALPWAGWKFVQQLEFLLRQGQEQALLASAEALARGIAVRPASLPPAGVGWFAHRLAFAPRLDGGAIGQATVDYVKGFIAASTGPNYNAHLTVGIGTNGFIDSVETKDVTRYEAALLSYMRSDKPEILAKIRDTKALDDETAASLGIPVARFRLTVFVAGALIILAFIVALEFVGFAIATPVFILAICLLMRSRSLLPKPWKARPLVVAEQAVAQKLDPAAYAECLKQLPPDSIEAEAASDERQQKQWASPTLGR